MTWSYSGDPSTSDKDAVRFWSGDVDDCDPLVSNEEILYVLSEQPHVKLAAADILDELANKFAIEVDKSVDGVRESAGKRSEAFSKRADKLRKRGSTSAPWFVGGLSKSGKDDLRSDEDAVQPTFSLGQDDYPGTTQDGGDVDPHNRR